MRTPRYNGHPDNTDSGVLPFVRQRYAPPRPKSTMDIYADDTNLSLSSNWKTLPLLNQSLSQDLSEVDRWARENKMYMNMQKSKALLVTRKRLQKRMVQDTGKLEVKTDNEEIEQVANHKLRGMIIDEHLTFEVHVDKLCINFSRDSAFYAILAPT